MKNAREDVWENTGENAREDARENTGEMHGEMPERTRWKTQENRVRKSL